MKLLVKHAQKGDAEAFIQLIEKNQSTLRRVAFGFLENEEDVADAIGDTVLDAYEHIKEVKKPEFFRTWLVRILMNNCTRIYNQNKNKCSIELVSNEVMTEFESANMDFLEMLRSLPEEDRTIFQLYFGEQFTTKEISEILYMKESTVKSRIRRGKEKLRKDIQLIC